MSKLCGLGLAVAALLGLSGAALADGGHEFPNCSAARAAGYSDIPRGSYGYGPHLDRDGDGIACES